MKKIWSFITNFFLNSGAQTLMDQGAEVADKALVDFYASDPVAATALVKALYAFVPYLQTLTAKTGTTLDDQAVAEIKSELEKFAAANGIVL